MVAKRTMPFVSWSQNFEDLILDRCFFDRKSGVYVDVGAHSPIVDSVTEALYQRGWSGLNIDALSEYAPAFRRLRPRDTHIQAVVGDKAGKTTFYEVRHTGLSTTSKTYAARHRASGFEVIEHKIERKTLSQICTEAGITDIDLLKIDVEGDEGRVIRGFNWQKWRPRVVVVEATEPNAQTLADHWSPVLEGEGYQKVLFDGLNLFFVANECPELQDRFRLPPNVFDDYVRAREHALTRYCFDLSVRRWVELLRPLVLGAGNPEIERTSILRALGGDWSAEAVFPVTIARAPRPDEVAAWNSVPCTVESDVLSRIALLIESPEYRELIALAWQIPGQPPVSITAPDSRRAAETASDTITATGQEMDNAATRPAGPAASVYDLELASLRAELADLAVARAGLEARLQIQQLAERAGQAEMRAELERIHGEAERLRQTLAATRAELEAALAGRETELQAVRAQLDQSRSTLDQLQREQQGLLRDREQELAAVQSELQTAHAALATSAAKLAEAQSDHAGALRGMAGELDQARAELLQARGSHEAELQTLARALDHARAELLQVRGSHEAELQDLARALDHARAELVQARGSHEAEVQDLTRALDQARAELSQASISHETALQAMAAEHELTRSTLAQMRASHASASRDFADQLAHAHKQLAAAQARLADLDSELAESVTARAALSAELDAAVAQLRGALDDCARTDAEIATIRSMLADLIRSTLTRLGLSTLPTDSGLNDDASQPTVSSVRQLGWLLGMWGRKSDADSEERAFLIEQVEAALEMVELTRGRT